MDIWLVGLSGALVSWLLPSCITLIPPFSIILCPVLLLYHYSLKYSSLAGTNLALPSHLFILYSILFYEKLTWNKSVWIKALAWTHLASSTVTFNPLWLKITVAIWNIVQCSIHYLPNHQDHKTFIIPFYGDATIQWIWIIKFGGGHFMP